MKKFIIFLVAVIVAIGLMGCSQKEVKPVTVEYNGQTYTVYTDRNIVSDGTHSYSYSYSYGYDQYDDRKNYNDITIFITYPDGSTWKLNYDKRIGPGSSIIGIYSDLTVPVRYVSGGILFNVINEAEDEAVVVFDYRIVIIIVGIILFAFPIAAPGMCWRLFQRKKKRYVEPTETLVIAMRLIASTILITVVVIIISL